MLIKKYFEVFYCSFLKKSYKNNNTQPFFHTSSIISAKYNAHLFHTYNLFCNFAPHYYIYIKHISLKYGNK